MKVRIEYGDKVWEGDLPASDFLLVATTCTAADEAVTGVLAGNNGHARLWKASECAADVVDALRALPFGEDHSAKPALDISGYECVHSPTCQMLMPTPPGWPLGPFTCNCHDHAPKEG